MASTSSGATPARVAFLSFGVLMAASAVLMIKASALPPALLASARLLGATVILLPFWVAEQRKHRLPFWESVGPSILPGLFLGLHFISWNAGARATLAGNASLVVNLVPLVMPFLAWWFLREKPTRREVVGTSVALLGVVVLALGDYHFSPEHLLGDGLCFLSMLVYAAYLMLARKRARPGALLSYLTPLYLSGGVVCLAWALAFERPFPPVGATEAWLVAGLVFLPTLLGHSITNWAMTVVRAQVTSLLNLTQFIYAGFLAFLFFGEVPDGVFLVTAVLVATGAAIALLPGRKRG